MKTYEQVIARVADAGFHTIMSGSMNSPFYGQDLELIAFTYEVSEEEVYAAAAQQLNQIQQEYAEKYRLTHS
jgi:hypothetical protein